MNPEGPYPPPLPSAATTAGYCRACGKALDQGSVRHAMGAIYCQEHVPMDAPQQSTTSPYTTPPPAYTEPVVNPEVSPPLAFMLGFIPGVGAIYNGQYIKGLIHVALIGLAISILSSDAAGAVTPLVALMLAAFWIYMPFEAFHTAKFRRSGKPVDAVSSLVQLPSSSSKFPAGAVILIALGIVLLLDNLGLLELRRALRYWPALLIAAGLYMLYARVAASSHNNSGENR
jgi:TM2 domain-containing membrane protein YozV